MSIAIQAETHSYLLDKFSGKTVLPMQDFIGKSLHKAGIPDTNDLENYLAFIELVDFRTLFVDAANQMLIDKWSGTTETWRMWVNNYGLKDFKPTVLTAAGIVPSPTLVNPGAEYRFMSEMLGENVLAQLKTYGDIVQLQRRIMMDDDISGIAAYMAAITQAFDRQIGDKAYSLILDNPVTFNDQPLFSAQHNNLVQSAVNPQMQLAAAIKAMTNQKMTNDENHAGMRVDNEKLRITPKYVLSSPAKAFQLAETVKAWNDVVPEYQKLEVVPESRLDDFEGFFLAANNNHPSVSLFTLKDRVSPEILAKSKLSRDGMEIKYRMDYEVGAVDYRSIVRVEDAA